MYLIFDTETTGLPQNWQAPLTDFDNWPRMVQLAWQMHDEKGALIEVKNFIIKPEGYDIPYNSEKIHGITTERAQTQGIDLKTVLQEFSNDVKNSEFVVGHNVEFDNNIMILKNSKYTFFEVFYFFLLVTFLVQNIFLLVVWIDSSL